MALSMSRALSLNSRKLKQIRNTKFSLNLLLPQYYSKNALRRKPVRILNSEGQNVDDDLNLEKNTFSVLKCDERTNAILTHEKHPNKLLVPRYEKLSRHDAQFTKLLSMCKHRKQREKSGKILVEGTRLINDAIKAGLELKNLFFSKEETLAAIKLKSTENVAIQKVFYRTLSIWSSLTTCPGIMGVFKKPTVDDMKALSDPVVPVTVICDNIRDPGNLGAIIRNAAAAGCRNILLTKGCVDPWEIKVIRAGCGGHFRIPIVNNIKWSQLINYISKDATLYVADGSADIDLEPSSLESVTYDEPGDEEVVSKHRYVGLDENNQPVLTDESFEEPSELEKYEEIQLPCQLYTDIKYPKKDIFLYVGGETHGVNPQILKLACEFGGKRVKIPLENEMESLNVSFAFAIVLYEIKRQMTELYVMH